MFVKSMDAVGGELERIEEVGGDVGNGRFDFFFWHSQPIQCHPVNLFSPVT